MYERSRGTVIEKARGFILLGEPADLEEREAAGLAGVPLRLGGGDLHALRARHGLAEAVADDELEERDRHRHDQRQLRRLAEEVDVPAAQEVPAADPRA